MNRLAYYLWRMIPLRYIFKPLATWLLPHACAYAFRDPYRAYLSDELRKRWWNNAALIAKEDSQL